MVSRFAKPVIRLGDGKNTVFLLERGVRLSTAIQDRKVVELILKGVTRKEVAGRLSISYHQVCHSIKRMRASAIRPA